MNNGIINPNEYINNSIAACNIPRVDDATSMAPSIGPTHGVNPTENNAPKINIDNLLFSFGLQLMFMKENPLPDNVIIPNISINIPAITVIHILYSAKKNPMNDASIPNITNTKLIPKKNINVIFVMFFFSPNVQAKNAGNKGKTQGDNKLNIPPKNAIRNDNKAAWLWLYSFIFFKLFGNSSAVAMLKTRSNAMQYKIIFLFI